MRRSLLVLILLMAGCAGGEALGPVSAGERDRAVATMDGISREIEARCAAGSEADCSRGEITSLRLQMQMAERLCAVGDPESCRRRDTITRTVLDFDRMAEACGGWLGPGVEECRCQGRVPKGL